MKPSVQIPGEFTLNVDNCLYLFEATKIGVVICSAKGDIFQVNPQWSDRIHNGKPSHAPINLHTCICEEYRMIFDELLSMASEAGLAGPVNIDICAQDDHRLSAAVVCKRLFMDQDCYLLSFEFTNTSTEDSAVVSEAVFYWSPEQDLMYVNNAFRNMFGIKEEEVESCRFSSFFADGSSWDLFQAKLNEEQRVLNEILKLQTRKKSMLWGLFNGRYKYLSGKPVFVGSIIDITTQRKNEELLRAKNTELKKINAEMDRFLYSASHDIRSPMTSIMGMVNILRMEIPADKHSHLDKIDASLKKLDYFISEVVQFSQNARTRIQSDRIDFTRLIQDSWQKINGVKKGITLKMRLPERSYYFYSDQARLEIVLTNLLKNSCQYMDRDKLNPWIKIVVRIDWDCATIVVTDNGIGIDSAHQEKVFQMFYKANERNSGSGMGLYIVKETLNKLNGSVLLKSRKEHGTSIEMKIPNDSKGRLMNRKIALGLKKNT